MNKKVLIVILSLALALFAILFGLIPILQVGRSQSNDAETFLTSSTSPNEKYVLAAYKTEPGATVDFSVRVYLIEDQKKRLIYNAYHEYEATIIWTSDDEVIINGKTLNLARGETYDWRTD